MRKVGAVDKSAEEMAFDRAAEGASLRPAAHGSNQAKVCSDRGIVGRLRHRRAVEWLAPNLARKAPHGYIPKRIASASEESVTIVRTFLKPQADGFAALPKGHAAFMLARGTAPPIELEWKLMRNDCPVFQVTTRLSMRKGSHLKQVCDILGQRPPLNRTPRVLGVQNPARAKAAIFLRLFPHCIDTDMGWREDQMFVRGATMLMSFKIARKRET